MANGKKFAWGKWLVILLLLGGGSAGAVYYLKHRGSAATEYQTGAVTRGDLVQAVTATGQLAPVVNVQVGSQISGIVRELFADFNSVVHSNEVIALIDPSTYKVNVLKAEAELANAKANLALAEVQAKRSEELFKNNLVSSSDHDTALAQLKQAQAVVQSDEASLQNAKVQLSYCTIFAPVDGVVVSRNVDVGQTVAASFNTPTLFLIAGDLKQMQIDALVSEADIGGVATNQDVNFTVDAYPYRTFQGKVSQVRYGAITNQNVISYDCVIQVNNADLKLLPGMTANVSIVIAERNNALRIPNAALRFRPADVVAAETRTNAPGLQAMGQGSRSGGEGAGRPGGMRGGMGGGGGGSAAFGGGERRGQGGEGGAGGARRPKQDKQVTRTVYVLPARSSSSDPSELKPQPVQIKTGISDGVMTEVVEGVEEGAQVVTSMIAPSDSSRPAANPFGGGFRRF
ncbi:MAG TPA: efflux RND transporter periplasmic adaptor subunit [Verrucomicrobiae bacterium]